MDLLERAVKHFGTANAVADYLGIKKSQMSLLRSGKRNLQPIQAAKLAEALGERWLDQVLPILAGLEPSQEDKDYWLGKLGRLAQSGVLVGVLGIAALLHQPDAQAASGRPASYSKISFGIRDILYNASNWIRASRIALYCKRLFSLPFVGFPRFGRPAKLETAV